MVSIISINTCWATSVWKELHLFQQPHQEGQWDKDRRQDPSGGKAMTTFSSRQYSLKYDSDILSILIYGSERWETKANRRRNEVLHTGCMRRLHPNQKQEHHHWNKARGDCDGWARCLEKRRISSQRLHWGKENLGDPKMTWHTTVTEERATSFKTFLLTHTTQFNTSFTTQVWWILYYILSHFQYNNNSWQWHSLIQPGPSSTA